MYRENLSALSDILAEKYINLKELELLAHESKKLLNTLICGKLALQEAKRIQEEFFPMSNESEKIIMTLLNQKFSYDGVDYSNEVNDKIIVQHAEAGLFLYTANAIADEVNIINKTISDLQSEEAF